MSSLQKLLSLQGALVCLLLVVTCVRADGPISKEDCKIINPTWDGISCVDRFPIVNSTFSFTNLPWDSVTEYKQCVVTRCLCTGHGNTTGTNTNNVYCGDGSQNSFTESGYMTCNAMVDCYADFWRCATNVLVQRNLTDPNQLNSAENLAMTDILDHARSPGQDFAETKLYASCRLLTCQAAESRQNCGASTCMPNFTQCVEYIRPPPPPYKHQLCTQGCRAVLVMMACTLVTVSFALCCVMCCPRRMKVVKPLLDKNQALPQDHPDHD